MISKPVSTCAWLFSPGLSPHVLCNTCSIIVDDTAILSNQKERCIKREGRDVIEDAGCAIVGISAGDLRSLLCR